MARIAWTRNEEANVPRATGLKWRVRLAKETEPMKKKTMEMRDLSQPHGLPVGWLEAPRPRKIVFPCR